MVSVLASSQSLLKTKSQQPTLDQEVANESMVGTSTIPIMHMDSKLSEYTWFKPNIIVPNIDLKIRKKRTNVLIGA